MSRLVLLLLIFSFSCSDSREDFDTSPFGDKELLPYEPLSDLVNAVIVFEKTNQDLPKNLSSLKNLSRENYIDACITDGIEDSILVDDSKLDFFSDSKTTFTTIPSGLEIHFEFKDSSLTWFSEWNESLYSTDFDSYTFVEFDVFTNIEKGKGKMKIQLSTNETEIIIEELSGRFGLSTAQNFHLINEQIIMENPRPLCLEE